MRTICLILTLALGSPVFGASTEPIDAELLAAARTASEVYQRHIASLMRQAEHGATIEDRVEAIHSLGHTVDPQVGPRLLPFLDADLNPPEVVEAAVHALAILGFAEAEGAFRRLLGHDNPTLDRAARNALSALELQGRGDYEGEAVLDDPDLRASGVTNIGTQEITQATGLLTRALDSGSRHVRRMAAIGLGRIGSAEHGHDLIRALHDPDPLVRRYAAEALTRLDYKPAIPFLLLSLESNIAGGDMYRALYALTGKDFGWRVHHNRVLQQEAVERGFEWWTENSDRFGE